MKWEDVWAAALTLAVVVGLVVVGARLQYHFGEQPSIGGTTVPRNLGCEEDEVIAFVWQDTLRCVHAEDVFTSETSSIEATP